MKKSIGIFLTSLLTISAIAFAPASTAAGATDSYWGATATATTNYNGYEASFATGAPDATFCGDISGQAWTYYEPYVDSQLVVELAEPMSGTELAVYFSNDLEDLIRIELFFEGQDGFYQFSHIAEDVTCESNADSEYPNNIKITRVLSGFQKVSAIRFTVLTDAGWPEIDAVAVVATRSAKPAKEKNPVIAGTAKVGKKLVANEFPENWGGYPNPEFSFQWFACTKTGKNSPAKKPRDCTAISGATDDDFKLKAGQKGKFIRVRVTASNSAGSVKVFSKTSKKVS
jgi:hypothetical protein